MKGSALAGLTLITFAVSWASTGVGTSWQKWEPGPGRTRTSLKPEEGQLSPDVAVAACERFIARAGLATPNVLPWVDRSTFEKPTSGLYHVNYGRTYEFCVDVGHGRVVEFRNEGHYVSRGNIRAGSHAAFRFRDIAGIQVYARQYATRLEVPVGYKMTRLQLPRDEGSAPGHSSFEVLACFEPMPYGHCIEYQPDCAVIRFDRSDGTLTTYAGSKGAAYIIDSHEAKLKFAQANEIGRPIALRFSVGQNRGTGPSRLRPPLSPGEPSYLGYVRPNGEYDKPIKLTEPFHLRLAWVLCYANDEEIWIDAADGKLLGGKYRGRHVP